LSQTTDDGGLTVPLWSRKVLQLGATLLKKPSKTQGVVQMVVEEMLKDGEPIPEEPSGDVKVFPEVHIAVAGLG
jgi:hypothetical protein